MLAETLTVTRGQWSGTEPITYSYSWGRCDRNGNACVAIGGATGSSYTATAADVGHTLRAKVVARNARGSNEALSRPSGVVAPKTPPLPPGAIRLPSGEVSIPVSSVSLPDRLVVSKVAFAPGVVRSRNELVTARFRVTDTRGYVVRDANVLATPLPYVWAAAPRETATGTDGWATAQFRIRPNVPRKGAIVVFARAREPGGSLLAGVSTRRLVQVLVKIGG